MITLVPLLKDYPHMLWYSDRWEGLFKSPWEWMENACGYLNMWRNTWENLPRTVIIKLCLWPRPRTPEIPINKNSVRSWPRLTKGLRNKDNAPCLQEVIPHPRIYIFWFLARFGSMFPRHGSTAWGRWRCAWWSQRCGCAPRRRPSGVTATILSVLAALHTSLFPFVFHCLQEMNQLLQWIQLTQWHWKGFLLKMLNSKFTIKFTRISMGRG